MSFQIACLRIGVVTLVAFVWFFSTVCFQMPPQIACLRRCIVTLVTFVWFFATVCCQMCFQMALPRGSIFTLVAFEGHPIMKELFAKINIHHCLQFDAFSFAASVQLTQLEQIAIERSAN